MRIVCPACGAAYEVPQDRLAPGRVVRCARCSANWAPLPAEPASPPEPERPRLEERLPRPGPALPVPEAPPLIAPVREQRLAPAPVAERRRGGQALALGWVLSFVVLGALAWAAYDRREDVMRAWPASERAYMALGMTARR